MNGIDPADVIAVFSVPWMPPALQPNNRAHWSKKTKPRRVYKSSCWTLALGAKAKTWRRSLGSSYLGASLVFHPPTNQVRDLDNCLAAFKAGIDGIAIACGVDDSGWRLRLSFGPPVVGGAVAVCMFKSIT